uniref:Uncharacterized protein n=1 Tax=Panagrolaimus sp. ES5 TaxID=591445 RepID=A0AC34F7B0_9BILA
MSQFFDMVTNQKKYMAFVNGSNSVINVTVIDIAETHSIDPNLSFTTENAKEFVENIPRIFWNCKSVILSIFDIYSNKYANNLEFCIAVKTKMKKHKIQHEFISSEHYFFSTALIASNVCLQNPCFFILVKKDKMIIASSALSQAGHQLKDYKQINLDENADPKNGTSEISISGKIDCNIILIDERPDAAAIKISGSDVSETNKVHCIENINNYKNDFALELTKWQMFDFYNQYNFLPICIRKFLITDSTNNEILSTNLGESLPLKKSCIVPTFPTKYFLKHFDETTGQFYTLSEIILDQPCHENIIDLTVDKDNFPNYQLIHRIVPEIQFNFRLSCAKNLETYVPIIGFRDNLSFICASKNRNKYDYFFLEGWNDILSIMSMPADNVKVKAAWGFGISKNEKYPILIGFNDFNGNRNAASPAFLMALLLKEHLKAIQTETGEYPKEIAFYLFNRYNEEEESRIKQQLKKSCQILKLKCTFVKKE